MNYAILFDRLRNASPLGPTLSQAEVDGVSEIMGRFPQSTPVSWVAYALATAYHETAGTMQPIKERGSESYFIRLYDVTGEKPQRAIQYGNTTPGDGPKYCGRGYVQLTWKKNYEHAGKKIGRPLETNPDLAMDPRIAAQIMVQGMTEGWFTGKCFANYLPKVGAQAWDFVRARRIINGTDQDTKIAGYALSFESALISAEWGK